MSKNVLEIPTPFECLGADLKWGLSSDRILCSYKNQNSTSDRSKKNRDDDATFDLPGKGSKRAEKQKIAMRRFLYVVCLVAVALGGCKSCDN